MSGRAARADAGSRPHRQPMAALARPSLLGDVLVMTRRSVRVVARTPAAIVAAIFMPLVLMVVMTAGFAKVVTPDGSYGDYVNRALPLFAVMGMTFSAVTTGVSAHRDLRSGMDARLRTLPMSPVAPLAGRILGDATRNLLTIVVLSAVGAIIGFRVRAGIPAALAAVGLALLVGIGFAWLAIAAAVRSRSAEAMTSLLNGVLLVLSFLSTGMVPADDLPGWAQPIADHSPVSAAVEAMRVLTQGGPTSAPVAKSLAWSMALAAVFATAALTSARRQV